jgi:hypothetical protein
VSLSSGSQNTEATVSSNSPTSRSPGHIAECGLEESLSSGSSNTEETPTNNIFSASSSNSQILECEKDSFSYDPQATEVPKSSFLEDGINLHVASENIEGGEGFGQLRTNHFISKEADIIPVNLKHSQCSDIDPSVFKWSTEQNISYSELEGEDLKHVLYSDTVSDVHMLDLKQNSVLEQSNFMQAGTEIPSAAGHISEPSIEQCNGKFDLNLTNSLEDITSTHTIFLDFGEDILSAEETNSKYHSPDISNHKQVPFQPIAVKHPDFEMDVLKPCVNETKEIYDSHVIKYGLMPMRPIEMNALSPDLAAIGENLNDNSKFLDNEKVPLELAEEKLCKIHNYGQVSAESREMCDLDMRNCEQASENVIDLIHSSPSDIFSEKEPNRVVADVDLWEQNQCDNICILMDDFLLEERLACGLTAPGADVKREESFDAAGEEDDDGEGFALNVVKHSTPDDERSSDSGFRDKGSLSESCEEACDEKYNLEDIEAELEDTFSKGDFRHDDRALERHRKLSDSSFTCIERPEDDYLKEGRETVLPVRSSEEIAHSIEDLEYFHSVSAENSNDVPVEGNQISNVNTIQNAENGQEKTDFVGDFIRFEAKHYLKPECWDSHGSGCVQGVPELVRTQCDINSHHYASPGSQQLHMMTVTDDSLNTVLPVELCRDLRPSIVNSNMSVNEVSELLVSNRESQNAELMNCETVLGQQQMLTDSNVDDNQSNYPVIVPASDANVITIADSIPGANLSTHILINDAVFTECENKHGEMLSSISPVSERKSPMDGHFPVSMQNSGFSVIQTSSFDEAHVDRNMFMSGSKPDLGSRDVQRAESPTMGWYLHPPPRSTDCEGGLENFGECTRSIHSGSCSSEYKESSNSDNSYVSFSLDEEFVSAIRNELRDKLPFTCQQSEEEEEEEEEDEEEDEVSDTEDDLLQEERTNVMIHYNICPAQLSPILEERESLSSITTTISDRYSPLASSNHLDAAISGCDSDSPSPVFVLDPREADSGAQYEVNAWKFEQDIRDAFENYSLSSEDISGSCDEVRKESSVLFEDLEQQTSEDPQRFTLNRKNVVVVQGTNQHPDDDLLLINTETNEATLLESPKPKSHLAFVNNRRTQENRSVHELSGTASILSDDEIVVGSNSDTFVIDRSRFSDMFDVDSKFGLGREMSPDEEVYTPDSISPEHATGTPSASIIQSSDTENLSDFFLTPSKKSCTADECPKPLQDPKNSTVYNPYFLHTLSKDNENPTFEEVQEISLGVANNEAAEIILELQSSGIFNNNNNCTNDKGVFVTVLPLCEEVSVLELPSSRTSDVSDNSEVLSAQNNAESPEMSRKDFSDDNSNPKKMSAVDRLNYLTSSNLDVLCVKTKESIEEEHRYSQRLLDLLKIHKESQENNNDPYHEDEEKDWSLPNIEASVLSTRAPMPSPEEESWKQIPSMLAFSDVNEVITRCSNKHETFGRVCFNGPANYVDDGDLMSTSFSIKDDPGDSESYTPDWESDSNEANEDDNSSSSSGEFIWKVCTWFLKIIVCKYRNGSLLQCVLGKIKGLQVRLCIRTQWFSPLLLLTIAFFGYAPHI